MERVTDGAMASDVLKDELGGFCTPDKLDFLATQYEMNTGLILRRDNEMPPADPNRLTPAEVKSEKAYQERYVEFRKIHPAPVVRKLSMNPESARRTLDNFERKFKAATPPKTKEEKEKAFADYEYMNGCRAILGMPPHNYVTDALPDEKEVLHEEFNRFQKHSEPAQRLALVKTLTNGNLVRLIALHDTNDRVKNAAEERLGALQILGKR